MIFAPLPPQKSKPGTDRYQFYFNGVKIPIERHPSGQWRCWIDILTQDRFILLEGPSLAQAQESLRKLLIQHFEALVLMLKGNGCTAITFSCGMKAGVITNTSNRLTASS